MNKAEDKAKEFLKKLVSHTTLYKGTIDELEVYEPDDVIWAYKEGYHQAKKDLELSWEDISTIRQIMFDYNRTIRNEMPLPSNENYCKEVLKRFKETKKVD